MNLLTLLKGKLLVTVVASMVLVGGATAALAATSGGQIVVQSLTHRRPTVTATATHGTKHDGQDTDKSNQDQRACPSLSDAQKLATSGRACAPDDGRRGLPVPSLLRNH
jgi:hypothetical protein